MLSRRQLIVLASAAALGGCASSAHDANDATPTTFPRGPIDAGAPSEYPRDGIYARFSRTGAFFVVRQGTRLFVLSAICTHRACALNIRRDGLLCPCHGSTFTMDGHVTRGPARRDLPRFAVSRNELGHLLVHTDRPLWSDHFNEPDAFIEIG